MSFITEHIAGYQKQYQILEAYKFYCWEINKRQKHKVKSIHLKSVLKTSNSPIVTKKFDNKLNLIANFEIFF